MFPTRFSASLPFHAVCSCLHYHTLNSPTSSWFAESQVIQTAQVWLSFSFDTNVYSYHKGHRKLCKNFHNQWGESICWIVLKKFDLCFVVFFSLLQDIFPVIQHYLNIEHIGSILTANSLLWNNSSWCL